MLSRILRFAAILALILPSGLAAQEGEEMSREPLLQQAREILRQVPLVDGHNDVPWQYRRRVANHLAEIDLAADTTGLEPPMHTDLPRLRKGGVGAQFWSVFVPASLPGPEAARATFEQIDLVHRMIEKYPEDLELALTAADIRRVHGEGRIASLIGMEGGHSIANSLGVLRQLYRVGARYMTITHSLNVDWADSATDEPALGGLSPFGREVIREMNRLGMLVDLSHVSPAVMHQVLDIAEAPVIFSHSSAFARTAHPRNVPDDVLKRLADNGGVVMVTYVPAFVSEPVRQFWAAYQAEQKRFETLYPGDPEQAKADLDGWLEANPAPTATLSDVADHIDHLRQVAGIDHVGIGSDFDGIRFTPDGLGGADTYPDLLAELLHRGYSAEDVGKIAGLNALRAFEAAERAAARLQGSRAASDALFEELDEKQDSATD